MRLSSGLQACRTQSINVLRHFCTLRRAILACFASTCSAQERLQHCPVISSSILNAMLLQAYSQIAVTWPLLHAHLHQMRDIVREIVQHHAPGHVGSVRGLEALALCLGQGHARHELLLSFRPGCQPLPDPAGLCRIRLHPTRLPQLQQG